MKRLLLLLLSSFLLGSCHCGDADSKQAFQNAVKEVTATITAEKLPERRESFMSGCDVHCGASASESALRPESRSNFSLTGRRLKYIPYEYCSCSDWYELDADKCGNMLLD